MNILSIETSTNICGISYQSNGNLLGINEEDSHRKHAEVLPDYFKRLKDETSFELMTLNGIAISIGPGSFTGLRVGLSFAKGLAFSHSLPIVPVPTLAGMALSSGLSGNIGVLLHSHGSKVYKQSIHVSGKTIKSSDDLDLYDWGQIKNMEPTHSQWVQWGCDSLKPSLNNCIKVQPSSQSIATLAEQYWDQWIAEDPKVIVPDYISSFNFGQRK